MDICSYPQLFAACHVLLRLLVPRHPPNALFFLTFVFPVNCLFSFVRFLTLLLVFLELICSFHGSLTNCLVIF